MAKDIDQEIKDLQKKASVLLKEKESQKREEKIKINKSIIGKFYKKIESSSGGRNMVRTNKVSFVRVIDFIRYTDGKIMYGEDSESLLSESFSISFSPAGWKLIEDRFDSTLKRLAYISGENKVSVNVLKYHRPGKAISGSSRYEHSYFRAKEINDKGQVYDGYGWWKPCTKEEFYSAYKDALDHSSSFFKKMSKYSKKYDCTTEKMIPHLDDITLTKVSDFMKAVEDQKLDLDTLLGTLHGKIAPKTYFNNDLEIIELRQSHLNSDGTGLNLTICGGDEGTDYEPYTTKYFVEKVDIDWKTILYPIRTKIKSVLTTARELENLSEVYDVDNWLCSYDTSMYDAVFHNAVLDKDILDSINKTIKSNLR
jgi:hypothetical protein